MAFPALAQKITVHGTVVDEYGDALIGATVMEKGTTNGTAADFDGNFELSVPSNATLVVSYVGYDPMDVPVNGRTEIHVVMKENAEMLGEVMVIGYGTVKKADATGSVAVVTPDEVAAGISTSAQDLLVGASPGVVVTPNGGAPQGGASIRIRGGASLSANNDPLIVLDGVPLGNDDSGLGNSIGMISPDNIESMTILKDASATAIYGSRASNGVIIITTKKGKSGRPQVNFSANMTVNTPRKTWGVLSADEFRNVVINRWGEDSDQAHAMGDYDTNWQKEILRTAISQEYNLSVGGTVGFLPYRVSASYTGNSGIMKHTSMQRVTAGLNLTPEFFNGLLKLQANVKGYYIRNNWSGDDAIGSAIGFNPTAPVYSYIPTGNPDFPYFYNGYYTIQGASNHLFNVNADLNPVARQNEKNSYSDVWRSNGNFQVDYAFHFLPELHANLNLGYDVTKSTSVTDTYANSPLAWKNSPQQNGAGTHYWWYQLYRNTLLDFYLNYQKDFEAIQSNLNVMAGYSWQRFDYHNRQNGTEYTHNGFTISKPATEGGSWLNPAMVEDEATGEVSPQNVPGTIAFPASTTTYRSGNLMLISFFGRINYSFKDTYLLTFTLRDDGTSRFSDKHRWGLFPSVALGWKINNMEFMDRYRGDMNEFKLRLGWGVTGQQDVGGWFPYMATYAQSSQGSYYPNMFNGSYLKNPNGPIDDANVDSWTYYPKGYNANLKWEETTTWNVGVDMGWWNNRLTINLDWYLRNTKDLLSFVTASPGAFTTNMLDQNIGTLRNIGVEATVGGRIIDSEKLVWQSSLNVAWNKNEITKLNNEGTYVQVGGISGGNGNTVQVHQVGYPAYSYLLYEQIYDNDGKPIEGAYVDQDGNGVIDANDLIIKHSRDPKVTMSWNNTFTFGHWDVGFQLRASIGNYVYNNALSNHATIEDMWMQQTLYNMVKNDFYFQGGQTTNTLLSDYWLENAGFVRCDNITVGYTWPSLIDGQLRLRLYGAVQNPFIITKYKGLDPEVFSGIDNNVYPRPVSFTVGIIASF
ncbi:MAG: TonB-dependent receptor [Muribaculaceae bacterium]|nr:TonB-dependent receptor [Muribaculaceae bacterium]